MPPARKVRHQSWQGFEHGHYQRLAVIIEGHLLIYNFVKQFFDGETQFTDIVSPNHAATAFQGMKAPSHRSQGFTILLIRKPAGVCFCQALQYLLGFFNKYIDDFVINVVVINALIIFTVDRSFNYFRRITMISISADLEITPVWHTVCRPLNRFGHFGHFGHFDQTVCIVQR